MAQQLQISRDLTQKQKHLGSDSEDEGFETEETSNPSGDNTGNPWVGGTKPDKDVTEFVSSYKKFWAEQSKQTNVEQLDDGKLELAGSEIYTSSDDEREIIESISNKTSIQLDQNNIGDSKTKHTGNRVLENKDLKRKKSTKNKDPTETSIKIKKKANLNNSSGDWDIEEMFDNAETKIKEKLKMKLSKTKDNKGSKGIKKSKAKKDGPKKKASKKIDLSIPSQSKKQIIDEEMIEQPLRGGDAENNTDIDALKNILGDAVSTKKMSTKQSKTSQNTLVDPEKFMTPKVTNLDSAIPDLLVEDENSLENNQKKIIMEAFEDNDIIDDFTKEKKAEVNKDQPKDIDLNLPGWGSWAGTGINPKKQRKRRRFIVKMPEVMPRRDDNKGTLIINEKAAAKVKPHLVSEVPFPFKTVKDYEASIRAPIGNTFVPELAYRRFIRPAVETRMGAIIEPATTGVLMGKPKKVH